MELAKKNLVISCKLPLADTFKGFFLGGGNNKNIYNFIIVYVPTESTQKFRKI